MQKVEKFSILKIHLGRNIRKLKRITPFIAKLFLPADVSEKIGYTIQNLIPMEFKSTNHV